MRKKLVIAESILLVVLLSWLVIDAVTERDPAGTFNRIYKEGYWGKNASGSGTSGTGSTVKITQQYRAFLEYFIKQHGVTSVVDAGCGDWSFSQKIDWNGASYLGIDISTVVIEDVKQRYETETTKFQMGDITEELPAADLLICKDVLQHLSNELVLKFVRNNLKPGRFKWAIITNDRIAGEANRNIKVGEHRYVDLGSPPFNVKGLIDLPIRFDDETTKMSQLLDLTKGPGQVDP